MADQENEIRTYAQMLQDGLDEVVVGEPFRRFLRFLANNPNYSHRNVLPILQQKPEATRTKGFKGWLKEGRCVREGQRGIRINICTQQSLSESISIDSVDYCFIAELHWNESRRSQFYYRFIRYTSTRDKFVYYVNYPESIETNLIYLLVAKERMLRFLKGQEISFEKLFTEMGFDLSHHRGAVFRK